MPAKPFRIGLRTIKTAISVAICVILFDLIHRDTPVLACLAAVYCTRTDVSTSFIFSKHRIIGTLIGGIISMVGILIQSTLPHHVGIHALIGGVGIICVIVICSLFKHPEGIVAASSTFLIIMFNTASTETVSYALQRMIDAMIGAAVAVAVDYLLPARKH